MDRKNIFDLQSVFLVTILIKKKKSPVNKTNKETNPHHEKTTEGERKTVLLL